MMWIWQLIWFLIKGPSKIEEEPVSDPLYKLPSVFAIKPTTNTQTANMSAVVPIIKPIEKPMPEFPTETNGKVYNTTKSLIGMHLSGDNSILGCATTVNALAFRATGKAIGGGASTAEMFKCLKTDPRFEQVTLPLPGDVIISPTGTSGWGPLQHGHVGLVMKNGICSNSSEDGKLHENYTLDSWNDFFGRAFKFPVFYFRFKDLV